MKTVRWSRQTKTQIIRRSQSALVNNVKMYRFDMGAVPRTPERTGSFKDFFPSADQIPQPVTAALAMFTPPRVYLIGGLASGNVTGHQQSVKYTFDAATTTFSLEGSTPLSEKQWLERIRAATMYYSPKTKSTLLFLFNAGSVLSVNEDLAVSGFLGALPGYMFNFCP